MSPTALQLLTSVGWTLVHFVWQGALIGCATALALTALRNARPEHRYAAACGGLVMCLLWPAADLYLRLAGADTGGPAVRDALGAAAVPEQASGAGLLGWLQGNLILIVACWAACAAALALRMGLGLLWIGRAAGSHSTDPLWQARLSRLAVQFGISRNVRLRIVQNLASPITAGWWRPVVLVPASLVSGMPPDLLEALLAHELAHVKRFDYLVNLGQNVVETLLFYHPAVWWISGRIRTEREQIADDFAARHLGEPRRLALALSELEKLQFSSCHLAQAANGGDLMVRVKRLIRPDTEALNWKAVVPIVGLGIALLAGCTQSQGPSEEIRSTEAIADFRSCSKPEYPKDALAAELEGTVTLSFLISAKGEVLDTKILKSSGHRGLDEAPREAISKCSFKPATKGGKPVEAWVSVQYVWTLA